MKQITIAKKDLKDLIQKEVTAMQKKLIDEDLYFSPKEKKEFLQSLKGI
jgi:hypothetical protein